MAIGNPTLGYAGRTGPLKVMRMPQIRHMKNLARGGVNPATASFPAGSRFKFIQTPVGGRGRR